MPQFTDSGARHGRTQWEETVASASELCATRATGTSAVYASARIVALVFCLGGVVSAGRGFSQPPPPVPPSVAASGASAKPWKPDCKKVAVQKVHHLEDNGGQVALTLERSSFSCWPEFDDETITIRSPSGSTLRFSARTVTSGPGQLDTEKSLFELKFGDGTVLELAPGAAVLEAPGITPVHPGSRFRYGGRELVFTIDRPVRPVWTSREGTAFRALLPAEAAETIQALADGQKALREALASDGFLELFVSLYLGTEAGSSGRDGYSVSQVSREVQHGDSAKPLEVFSGASTGRPGAEPGPKTEDRPPVPEDAGPESGQPAPGPTPAASPSPASPRR